VDERCVLSEYETADKAPKAQYSAFVTHHRQNRIEPGYYTLQHFEGEGEYATLQQ
jgi:hypothetical protein